MQDPRGWPSLSVMLTDDEKIMYTKCDYRTRIGVCGSKIMRIIDKRRRLGHVSDRCAFEMLGRIDVCMEAMGHIERAISSVMPFAFLHLMNFVLFFFAMSAPFVFMRLTNGWHRSRRCSSRRRSSASPRWEVYWTIRSVGNIRDTISPRPGGCCTWRRRRFTRKLRRSLERRTNRRTRAWTRSFSAAAPRQRSSP